MKKRILTPVDLCLAAYLLWGLLNMYLVAEMPFENTLLWKWTALLCIYLIARIAAQEAFFAGLIAAAGGIQSLWAVAQQAGWIASNHSLFAVTGWMGNPGQLGGFQAVAFIAACALLKKSVPENVRLYGVIGTLPLIGYSLWLADSRAGWVAAATGLVVLYRSEIIRTIRRHKWVLIPGAVALIALFALMFNYRSESAKARLLIWRVSAEMVAERPLTGHGVGQFNRRYMLYQARYFAQHPDSQLLMVADNAAYPYNEFLHAALEQGLIGAAILLLLIATALVTGRDGTALAPLAALVAFSCLSYPSFKFGLLALYPLLLGGIGGHAPLPRNVRRSGALLALSVVLAGLAVGSYALRQQTNRYTSILMHRYDEPAARFMAGRVDKSPSDLRLNALYLHWIIKYPEMAGESQLRRIFPTCENWCDIGDLYAAKGMSDRAETNYKTASLMIPTRLRPNYSLWKLYLSQDRTEQAKAIAGRMLAQPLKVENTFTLRAKAEVRDHLYPERM